jgi:hypothetical protein
MASVVIGLGTATSICPCLVMTIDALVLTVTCCLLLLLLPDRLIEATPENILTCMHWVTCLLPLLLLLLLLLQTV